MAKCFLCNRDLNRCKCSPHVNMNISNKKGQVIFYSFMMGVVVLILALAFAFPTRESADIAMNNTTTDSIGLSCQNSSISSFDKVTCYATDLLPFYFVGSLIMIAGVFLISKIIFES